MFPRYLKIILVLFFLPLFSPSSYAQNDTSEQHVLVALRMIGHQILLNSNDSVSLVLPIEKKGNRFKIEFEDKFQFYPEELAATIDSVMNLTRIASNYLVEVQQCQTGSVAYSYEINSDYSEMVPCRSRMQPKACYIIFISLLNEGWPTSASQTAENKLANEVSSNIDNVNYPKIIILICGLSFIIALFGFLWKKRRRHKIDPNLISIGEFKFNKKNLELLFDHQRIELTSKEADLLLLLNDAVDKTLEREFILKMVWGDEGDYIGRTLDVFISKLRKKLEADSNLKILNIRGVGYKLVMTEDS